MSANSKVIEDRWDIVQSVKSFSKLSAVESENGFITTFINSEDWGSFPTIEYFFNILADNQPAILENFGNDYEDDSIFNNIVRNDSIGHTSKITTAVSDVDALLRPVPVVNHTSNTLAGSPDEALAVSDAVFGGYASGISTGIIRNILISVDDTSVVGVTKTGISGTPAEIDLDNSVDAGYQSNEVQLGRDAEIDDLNDKNLALDDPSDMFQTTDLLNSDNIKRDAISYWGPKVSREHRSIRGADRLYRWRHSETRDWPVQFKAYGVLSRQDNTVLKPLH